ncbi:MAG: efflux RND transporter permease subunit [Treponema sp.]|uniref:efflux RND transporter permease subunit n=1 Tax=Treponema sp. TaxID=166 RepID=UPI00298DDFC0|nr:efflux RND transporter permease subunit [Treponema sp.]MCQ2600816.1 efflux RND transporter permease subunit [Treponema sp.]
MKTRNIFIIIIISLFLSFSIKFLKFTNTSNFNNLIFLIKYEYYGIDSQHIEQLITIPLEEELYALENVIELKSTSQLNQSITTITFNSDAKYDSTYLAIRKITEHFSNSLPEEVQPCKILISHTENSNIICTSFNCTKKDLEKYKQDFENIQGVSEVVINGQEDNNVIIEFSNLELANLKLTTTDIKRAVQNNNQNDIAIRQITSNSITRLSFNNKIEDIADLTNINIITDDRIIPLNKISKIYYGKYPDSDIFLINNTETSLLNLKMDSDANLISVSHHLKQILNKTNLASFEPVIIYDSGNEQFKTLMVISLLIFI